MILTIPSTAILPLWLAVLCGLLALLLHGWRHMYRDYADTRWNRYTYPQRDRIRRNLSWLRITCMAVLLGGGVLLAVFVLIMIVEAPRG